MAFSFLINKVFLGLFILAVTGYTDIFINAFSNGRIQPDCKQFENLLSHICDRNYDPVCSTNSKTYRNECEFCNVVKDTLDTVKFKHYGRCYHVL
ncbi:ovomucoid-like isoform X1 [Sminthopsis crassicaudata]|uniref:ovomucoid-like isoform X1 n=1 Tax=Sminthopsis crassicaudata TaxID=9301 RepID=UPI003D6804C0